MSVIFTRLRQMRQLVNASRRLPWVPVPPPGPDTIVLYQRASPWWAKWAHGLLALDIMLMTSIVEYTWDIGGFLRKAPKVETGQSETLPEQIFSTVQSQSVYKKIFFSGFYVLSGVIAGVALLASRSRVIRQITMLKGPPRSKSGGKFYIQAASHPKTHGIVFPANECSILKDDTPSKLLFRVKGYGGWSMLMNKAVIPSATAADQGNPRVALLRAWRNVGGKLEAAS